MIRVDDRSLDSLFGLPSRRLDAHKAGGQVFFRRLSPILTSFTPITFHCPRILALREYFHGSLDTALPSQTLKTSESQQLLVMPTLRQMVALVGC